MIGCAPLTGETDTAEISVPASKLSNMGKVLMQVMDVDGNYYIHEIPINLASVSETENATYLTYEKGSQPMPNANGLNPKNASNQWTYWGQTTDNITNNGNPITVSGKTFDRGIAMVPGAGHTNAIVVYDLTGGGYAEFVGYIGLADEHDHAINNNANSSCDLGGSVTFKFQIDGQTRFESGRLTGSDNAIEVRFEIPDTATELKIVVSDAGDGNWCDAAVIGDAKLIKALVEARQKSDVNNDGIINILDLVFVASQLGVTDFDKSADVNDDGTVNILDLVIVAQSV